ncbi:MAG: hypothetical protein WCS70_09025 [Verrucomicrobiota bacterium]
MNYKHKSMIFVIVVISLLSTGCSSVKPVAPQFSKDWLTLPPGAVYTNQSRRTEKWASEGIIFEKDQSIQWLLEANKAAQVRKNTTP